MFIFLSFITHTHNYNIMNTLQLSMTALIFTPAVLATDWKWVSSNDLCAGVQKTCDSKASCSSFALGPCLGDSTAATNYMESSFVAMGFVDSTKYLACSTSSCADAKLLEASGASDYNCVYFSFADVCFAFFFKQVIIIACTFRLLTFVLLFFPSSFFAFEFFFRYRVS